MRKDDVKMLTREEMRDKLFELPALFKHFYSAKDWPRAKHAYDTAVTVAVFAEMDEEDMIKLFGSRPYVNGEVTSGLFNETYVQKAYRECIRKNQTYENKRYPGIPAAEK